MADNSKTFHHRKVVRIATKAARGSRANHKQTSIHIVRTNMKTHTECLYTADMLPILTQNIRYIYQPYISGS